MILELSVKTWENNVTNLKRNYFVVNFKSIFLSKFYFKKSLMLLALLVLLNTYNFTRFLKF